MYSLHMSINYYINFFFLSKLYIIYHFRTDCWMDDTKKYYWQKRLPSSRIKRTICTTPLTLVILFRLDDVKSVNLCLYLNRCYLPHWHFWKECFGSNLYYILKIIITLLVMKLKCFIFSSSRRIDIVKYGAVW